MFRRSVRLTCLVIGLLATAGLSYRALQDEEILGRARQDAASADAAANQTAELLFDLRSTLHAYVAPGQGLPFWSKRGQETLEALRQSLVSLDALVAPTGASLVNSLDSIDQLTAAERRARTYAGREEMRLAGDVIFVEVRDLIAGVTDQVLTVRSNLKVLNDRRTANIRNEQAMLAGGAVALWVLIAMILLPTESHVAVKDPAAWRNELKETLTKPVPVIETPAKLVEPAPVPPPVPVRPSVDLAIVREASQICADLSALADAGALEGALGRVSSLLNATGLIVWMASNDGESLTPVATSGFDPKLVARIGKIPRESSNLTAAAFRDNTPKVSAASATAPAALAVAMCGPTGPSGVLSIELKQGEAVDDGKVALAAIVAAQLAALTMPAELASPAGVPGESEQEARRQAV
jgi:hypothetical protein